MKHSRAFTTDEDGDASACGARSPMKGAIRNHFHHACCPVCATRNAMHRRYGSMLSRFFRRSVGKNIDDVYSEYCHMARKESASNRAWLLRQWWSRFTRDAIELDGEMCEPRGKWGKYNKLWAGDYFTRAGSNTLEVVAKPLVIKAERKPTFVQVDAYTSFSLEDVAYMRKISCGVFERVVELCWFKTTVAPVRRSRKVSVSRWTSGDSTAEQEYKVEHYMENVTTKRTASKKDILKYNLIKEK